MHNLAKEDYLFEHQQRVSLTNQDKQRVINEALAARQPRPLLRFKNLLRTLNHVRHIRIEVTFIHEDVRSEATGVEAL